MSSHRECRAKINSLVRHVKCHFFRKQSNKTRNHSYDKFLKMFTSLDLKQFRAFLGEVSTPQVVGSNVWD